MDLMSKTRQSALGMSFDASDLFVSLTFMMETSPNRQDLALVNVDEVEFVLSLYSKLVSRYPELKSSSRLAIISPYRHQVKLLRENFRKTFGVESDKVVDINTVDGFQARSFISLLNYMD